MSEGKLKILLLGNELSLGEPIKEVLLQKGHQVFYVQQTDEATLTLTNNRIDIMFVDCMLPKISGVDYIVNLRKTSSLLKTKIVLMSGIYTDKLFIQEATKKTQAMAFIKKEMPFDFSQIFTVIDKLDVGSATKKEEVSPRKILYQIFSKSKVTNREKRKVIESLDQVSGFDLPFIYSLLVETKSSGYLNIYEKDGTVSGISFSSGNIIGVDVEDKKTILGEMLIQSGYSTPSDVQEAAKERSNLKFGQRLIKGNKLSPHAFDLILTEQMNIRLSRTVEDQKIKINFAATEVEPSEPSIDTDLLLNYLHDWVGSKLSLVWLKSLYVLWSGHSIVKSSNYRPDHPALQLSLVKQIEGLPSMLERGVTLNQLLETKEMNEEVLYKAIHFLLTKGLIIFVKKVANIDEKEQMRILKKMWSELSGKTEFEILDHIGMGTVVGELSQDVLHEEFLGMLGPEPSQQNMELYDLWHKVKSLVEKSVDVTENTSIRVEMRQAHETKEAQSKLKAVKLVDAAKENLMRGQFAAALEDLNMAFKIYPQASQLRLFMAWAKVGLYDPNKKSAQFFKDAELDLLQVPPEEKYDVFYPYITGLFQKCRGDLASAKKSFEKSVAINSSFMAARRELNQIGSDLKNKQDLLNMDLKKVVSGFFKRKN